MKLIAIPNLFIAFVIALHASKALANDQNAWLELKQSTAIAIMRHAIAPHGGPDAKLTREICLGQRNLSEQGREQAIKIGDVFRANDISEAVTYSSSLCRAEDTAALLGFDAPLFLAEIDSFIDDQSKSKQQSIELKQWITKTLENPSSPKILVTHGFNIIGLTGNIINQGDVLIVRIDNGEVITLAEISMNNL